MCFVKSLLAGAGLAASALVAPRAATERSVARDASRRRRRRSERIKRIVASTGVYERTFDKAGRPHGGCGDKLARRALDGTVGLTHSRGLLMSWASARANQRKHPFSSTKR